MESRNHKYSVESIRGFVAHPDNKTLHRDVVIDLLDHYSALEEKLELCELALQRIRKRVQEESDKSGAW